MNTVLVLSVAGKTLHDNPRLDMSRYIVATAAFSLFWAFFQGASIDRKSQGVVYNYETNRVEVSALSVGWIAYLDSVFTRGMVAAVALGPKFAVWDIVTTLMVSLRGSFTKIFFERWIGELKMKNPTWGDVANRVFSTTMNVLAPLDQFKAALMLNFAFLHLSVGLGTAVRAVLTTVGTLGLARLLFFTKRQSTVTGLARAGRWARRTLLGGPDPREGCDALLKVRFRDAQGADGAVGDQSALAVKP